MPTLRAQLLGKPGFSVDGKACKFSLKKSEALLIYCISNPDLVPRLKLCDLFWPGKGEQARRNLTDAIWRLTRDLKATADREEIDTCLSSTWEEVGFNFDCAYSCDVEDFERLASIDGTNMIQLAQLELAADLYRGEFLEAYHVPRVAVEFEHWAAEKRSALEIRYHELLRRLCIGHIVGGDYPSAIPYLRRLLAGDPEERAVYGLLMVCYAVGGQTDLARQTYQEYAHMLAQSFGMAPQASIQALNDMILRRELSDSKARELIAETIRDSQHELDPQVKKAFLAVLKATGIQAPPVKSSAIVRVLRHAQAEAENRGFGLIGTPQLFLSLCAEGDAHVRQVCGSTDVDLGHVTRVVHNALGADTAGQTSLRDYTLELQMALETAAELADAYEAETIDPIHVWIALLREENGLLHQALERCGVQREDLLARSEQIAVQMNPLGQ